MKLSVNEAKVSGLWARVVLLLNRSGFKMFLRTWKVFGTFEKRAPSQSQGWVEWLLHDMGYQSMSGTLFKYSTDNRSMWAFCYGFVNKLSISLEGLLNADMKSWLVSCSWWALMESIPARLLSLCTDFYASRPLPVSATGSQNECFFVLSWTGPEFQRIFSGTDP